MLAGREHWAGLLAWLDEHLAGGHRIGAGDLELLRPCDDPEEITAIVTRAHAAQMAEIGRRQPC